MHSFINSVYDRHQAIALAETPQGQQLFLQGFENCEAWFSIPGNVGDLFGTLMQLRGLNILARLFRAIPDASDLVRVSTRFNHWMLTTKMHCPPSDFPGLANVHKAAISASKYRFTAKSSYIKNIRRSYTTSGFVDRLQPKVSADTKLHQWLTEAMIARNAQTYLPARWFVVSCQGALLDVPSVMAFCQSGRLDGTIASPSIVDDMLNKIIELLEQAPVWKPNWPFDQASECATVGRLTNRILGPKRQKPAHF